MRYLILALLALTAGCASITPPAKPLSLRFIGEQIVPHRAEVHGTVLGGLSGIDYDAKNNLFYLLSDDRSDNGPARFYTAKIDITPDSVGKIDFQSAVILKQPNGEAYPDKTKGGDVPDPESIRLNTETNTLYWTSEGDKKLGLHPTIREITLAGQFIREFPLPEHLKTQPGNKGSRDNLTFEGLTIAPNMKVMWVGMEGPIFEDGEPASVGRVAGPARFTKYHVDGRILRQVAYVADAIPRPAMPPTGFADNGVPEILLIDHDRLLVLERAYMAGVGNSIRLYETNTLDGSNTLDVVPLKEGNYTPLKKRLVIDFDTLPVLALDNTEGMSWGPRLPNGNRTLVFVSDDNFSRRQKTQFLVFEVNE
jgi:hypothetical protein